MIDAPGIGDCFIGTIHSFANKIFKNSDEEYKLYTEEIQDQFMSVLITRFAKELKMDRYMNYKELQNRKYLFQLLINLNSNLKGLLK